MNRKIISSLLLIVVLVVLLAAILGLIDTALTLQERLQTASVSVKAVVGFISALLVIISGYVLWLIFKPVKNPAQAPTLDENSVRSELAEAQAKGVDASSAAKELQDLDSRRESGDIFLCLYGEISVGKSSLVNALLPEAEVYTDVRGGATTDIRRYQWQASSGDRLVLIDVPGSNDPKGTLKEAARDEATRAHVVVFVCDSDLSRSQWLQLNALASLGKPLVVALNKLDQFTPEQQKQLRAKIAGQLRSHKETSDAELISIITGGQEEVIIEAADGSQSTITRARKPDLQELLAAIQNQLAQSDDLEKRRDRAVLAQVAAKLEFAENEFRRKQAELMVRKYTGGAVVGALASITPGSDIVIQGVLATKMVSGLSELYGIPAKEAEISKLIDFTNRKMSKSTALVLAVAGNGLKAFPGVGTVSGGLMHAVAYGLLFDSFGHAIVDVLDEKRELSVGAINARTEERLDTDLLPRAADLIRLALEARRG